MFLGAVVGGVGGCCVGTLCIAVENLEMRRNMTAVVISLSLVIGLDDRGKALPKFNGDFKPSFVVEGGGEFCFFYGGMLWRLESVLAMEINF